MELITRAHLNAYQNNELKQDFLKGKPQNVYKALIDEVMTDLINRGVVIREEETLIYGDFEMNKYQRGPALNAEGCQRVTAIGLGDPDTYDQLFPMET